MGPKLTTTELYTDAMRYIEIAATEKRDFVLVTLTNKTVHTGAESSILVSASYADVVLIIENIIASVIGTEMTLHGGLDDDDAKALIFQYMLLEDMMKSIVKVFSKRIDSTNGDVRRSSKK